VASISRSASMRAKSSALAGFRSTSCRRIRKRGAASPGEVLPDRQELVTGVDGRVEHLRVGPVGEVPRHSCRFVASSSGGNGRCSAGTPMASVSGGTSSVTTRPAATNDRSPTDTPGGIVAFAPTLTSSPSVGPTRSQSLPEGMGSFVRTAFGPRNTRSPTSLYGGT